MVIMINNYKLGMKMLRYGSGLVGMMVSCGIFLLLGLAMNIWFTALGIMGSPGDLLLMLVVMFPVQVIYSLSISNLVQSSPAKKRMQTSVPTTVTCFNMIAVCLVSSLCKGIAMTGHPEFIGIACFEMVTTAVFSALIMLYIAIAYKYFLASITAGIMVYFFISARLNIVNHIQLGIFDNNVSSFVLALAISLLLIVLGGFGQYALSLLVYKAPMSKYAQSAAVRKEM